MRTHHAWCITAIVCLGLSSLRAQAADVSPKSTSLAIPINAANRPAGSIECKVTLGPTVPVTALAFSADGKTLASGGYREVLLWDLPGAKLARRIAAGGYVGAVALLKDGSMLAVGEGSPCASGAVSVLDFASGNEVFRFSEPKDVVTSLALSPDGKLLAAGGCGRSAYVWDVAQKKLATTIGGRSGRILHVSFSPDGKFLTTAGDDNMVQLWNVGPWTSVARFVEAYAVRGSAFHPDGVQVLLAVGGQEGPGLRFRKIESPAFRRPIGIGPAIPLGMIGPSKAGRVYVPCTDKTVKVFDIRKGNQVAVLSGHQDWVYAVALSPDQKLVASGSADGTVKLWSNEDGRLLATLVQLAPRADQWLALTAQGHLATSSPGAVAWKAEKLTTALDRLTAQLQKPELVAKTIAGEKVPAPVLK